MKINGASRAPYILNFKRDAIVADLFLRRNGCRLYLRRVLVALESKVDLHLYP